MDLLSILHVLRRHKRLAIPIFLLTAVAAVYVGVIKPPVYEATSKILLTYPPQQATKAQKVKNHALRTAVPYNTFTTYGSLQVVANAIMDEVTSPASQSSPLAAGSGAQNQLSLDTDYGDPPIIDITGRGSSRQSAIQNAQVVTAALTSDLAAIQQKAGINSFYMIKADNIVSPSFASASESGKIRSLVAVFAAGVIVLFIALSAADAMAKRRRLAALTDDWDQTEHRGSPRHTSEPGHRKPGLPEAGYGHYERATVPSHQRV